jgi:hypothetical protein
MGVTASQVSGPTVQPEICRVQHRRGEAQSGLGTRDSCVFSVPAARKEIVSYPQLRHLTQDLLEYTSRRARYA